jgi:multidrug resistance efflux pump
MTQVQRQGPMGAASLGRVFVFGGSAWLMGLALATALGQPAVAVLPATLHAKTQSVTASRPAVLAEVFVQTGQTVRPHQPLFRLTDERLAARLAGKQREIDELAAEVQRVEAAAEVNLELLRRELQRDAFEARLKLKQLQQDRAHRQVEQVAWQERTAGWSYWIGDWNTETAVRPLLMPCDILPTARLQALLQADETEAALEANAGQIAECERKLAELDDLERRLTERVRVSAGVDVARVKLQRAEAERQTLAEAEQALTICSTGFGTVGTLAVQPGDPLTPGAAIVDLLDDDQRFLLVRVPTDLVPRFQTDSKVTVLFPGRQRLHGVIAELPPQSCRDGDDGAIPVRITPHGKLWPRLPVGSRVTIEVPQ